MHVFVLMSESLKHTWNERVKKGKKNGERKSEDDFCIQMQQQEEEIEAEEEEAEKMANNSSLNDNNDNSPSMFWGKMDEKVNGRHLEHVKREKKVNLTYRHAL